MKIFKSIIIGITAVSCLGLLTACKDTEQSSLSPASSTEESSKLPCEPYTGITYINHSTIKIKTKDNKVIYVDPYGDGDYSEKADLVLVTHEHSDHNNISLVTMNENGKTIAFGDVLANGEYKTIDENGIKITGVKAENSNHSALISVGYIIEVDGYKIYHSGDTSKFDEMADLASLKIDYALLPMDGIYNMDYKEAGECANLIKAKFYIPIHTSKPGEPFNQEVADNFTAEQKIIIQPGKTLIFE